MIIRELNFDDFFIFMNLIKQLNNDVLIDKIKFVDYLLNVKKNSNKFIFVIEEEIDDIKYLVGTCCILIEQKIIHNYGFVAHIEDLVIDKNFKGKKYGSKLLKYCKDTAKQLNCYKIILNCKEEIKEFYIKNGFEFKQLQGSIYFYKKY